jgi:hypothetical protein
MPPKKRITHIRVGKPVTTSPQSRVFTNIYTRYPKAISDTMIPATVDILSGVVV